MSISIFKKTHKLLLINMLCFFSIAVSAQVTYTANDRIVRYDSSFRFGVNMGYYPNWTSEQLGNLSAGNAALGIKGVGVNTSRPALYEELLETFGYNALVPTFDSFYRLGIRDMTVIVGGPSGPHRDYTQYCPGTFSDVFANLYEPIWDGGANGTPINENNYYALYLWKMANTYKKYVKIWEIVNEPDYDSSNQQWHSDFDLNYGWWRNNPDPCTYQLHAPIQSYVRMLRISWEVLKSVNPDAQVSIGALGYASFLDVVLRNTDNPNNGEVSTAFPLKGGAYFDVMGYHIYPHLDGSLWTYNFQSDSILGFHRHSDGAIDSGLVKKQAFFQSVLTKYGYDGSRFPQKPWVVTEFNLPRRAFDVNYVGSNELQINSIIKAVVECYQRQILQLHVYQLGDISTPQEAFFEFQEMGLYNKLAATQPYNVRVNPMGTAYKTASDLLFKSKFDSIRTAAMAIPPNMDGGAFQQTDSTYVYVLWAKTKTDKSETANATYSFPTSLNLTGLKKYAWNFSETNNKEDIGSQNIALTGTPIFITTVGQTTNYCASKGTAPWELWVANVRFNTMNYQSEKFKDFATLGYSDYTNINTTVNKQQIYPLSITPGLSWVGNLPNAFCRVWMDFNDNKIFEDNEMVLEKTNRNPLTANVLIPTTAIIGSIRMRVAMKWDGYPTPCETFGSGEVEDYTINIQAASNDPCDRDVTPPILQNCPANIALTTTRATVAATWTAPTATDNCTATSSLSSTYDSGSAFPIGTTTVVYTAVDAKNNTTTCSFTVNVSSLPSGNQDIALSLSASPAVFKPFTPLNFMISAKNNWSQAFMDVKIEFKFPANTVNGGDVTPSVGTWQQWCLGGIECFTWTIPSFAANATATLSVPIYVLNPTPPLTAGTKLLSSMPVDNFLSNNIASISLEQATVPMASMKLKTTQQVPILLQKIAPNPSESEMIVELESFNEREVTFAFSDAFGKTVKTEIRSVGQGINQVLFDVSGLPQGVYFMSVLTNVGKNMPTKFIKM